jgi:hypothetical protein
MTKNERQRLREAIDLMSCSDGNCLDGWRRLCELAEIAPKEYPPFDQMVLAEQKKSSRNPTGFLS